MKRTETVQYEGVYREKLLGETKKTSRIVATWEETGCGPAGALGPGLQIRLGALCGPDRIVG